MLGNTYMYVAKKQVDTGHKMGGGNTLKKGKDIMLEVIAKNPNAYDAYFALGVFNYFAENVPSGLKWLAALLGFKGNKTVGMEYIRKAADNPNLTQGDAAFLLTYIYEEKEHQYDTASRYNGLLIEKYPNNPAFRYEAGNISYHAKKYDNARQLHTEFLAFCKTKAAGFCNAKYIFLANYDIASSYITEKKFAEAKPYIDAAIASGEKQYKGFSIDLDLYQGLIAKNSGKKDDALAFLGEVVFVLHHLSAIVF
jgi:tetratricopeptide (TPR) repeat protein